MCLLTFCFWQETVLLKLYIVYYNFLACDNPKTSIKNTRVCSIFSGIIQTLSTSEFQAQVHWFALLVVYDELQPCLQYHFPDLVLFPWWRKMSIYIKVLMLQAIVYTIQSILTLNKVNSLDNPENKIY